MKSQLRASIVATTVWPGILLSLFLMGPPGPTWATSSGVFTFENGHPAAVEELVDIIK